MLHIALGRLKSLTPSINRMKSLAKSIILVLYSDVLSIRVNLFNLGIIIKYQELHFSHLYILPTAQSTGL